MSVNRLIRHGFWSDQQLSFSKANTAEATGMQGVRGHLLHIYGVTPELVQVNGFHYDPC
jgi:hypothetical protein